jgi:hypothetical protein
MFLPINGRIAIIDDNIDQVLPLIEEFGQRQIPYIYYKGELKGLPQEGLANNDIRILFLDIYLNGNQIRSDKELKSSLISIIKRVIPDNNYPYLLVYWSRHEDEHKYLIEGIFKDELKTKTPIGFLSAQKSDFFSLTDDKTENYEENVSKLLDRINDLLKTYPVFSYLLLWENLIHKSADLTLEQIFKNDDETDNWDTESKNLFYKLSKSITGTHFNEIGLKKQVKNGLISFNSIFEDTLEFLINSTDDLEEGEKLSQTASINNDILYKVNKKLLFSDNYIKNFESGVISVANSEIKTFNTLLHNIVARDQVFALEHNNKCILEKIKDIFDEKIRKRTRDKVEREILSNLKDEIKKSWLPIEAIVTPVCDFVQGKEAYSKILYGFLIENQYKNFIDNKTEALFISPSFYFSYKKDAIQFNGVYCLVLDFRYFTSYARENIENRLNPILRVRQQLLSEIQSKLSRHINRQGILFLDEY